MEKVKIRYAAVIVFMVLCAVLAAMPYFTGADEPADSGKQLVVKVVADEELMDIDDYDIPLSSFSENTQNTKAGTRHIILMSAMLACVIFYVVYQGISEKKLITLRKQAALAQQQLMRENRKI